MSDEARAVIFDFGRVLGLFNNDATCEGLAEYGGHTPAEIRALILGRSEAEKTKKFIEFEKGLITPSQFYQWVLETVKDDRLLYADFNKIWGHIFSPNPEIEALLTRIKNDVQTFVLSNTDWIRWRYIKALPVIQKFFSGQKQQILSFRLHARKPDKEIFLEGVRRSGARPEEIIYIDDVPSFVGAARNLGMTGILYNCEVDPISDLEQWFSRQGII